MVVILEKGEHNADFHPMVDFIEASPLRYALTVKPTIYVSHIRQFWSTARIKTMEEGTKILATVDGILRTVTESSLRRNLKLRYEEGISSLPDMELFENLTLIGYNISPNQKLGEGSGTPTVPHHTPSLEAQSQSHTTHPSLTLLPVTTTSIPIVTPSDTPIVRQYTRRTRIAQSSVPPTIADEPASPLRDDVDKVSEKGDESVGKRSGIDDQEKNDSNIGIFDDVYNDREVGAEADTNNLELSTVVNPILTTRVIEAIKIFLAYASLMGFIVYQMDVKSAFLYGTIEEEVYMCQPPGFEDPHFPNKVYKQKDDGIFISQDKYVADILKKFNFITVKTSSTLIEPNKTLIKDVKAEDVDVHLHRSMIGSLMYLTASRPEIMFAVFACARFQVTPKNSHLHAVKRIFRYLRST
nr:uncharacterized mitochondrial protein AtMg00810-like [Tanacetum cinerariifolium]